MSNRRWLGLVLLSIGQLMVVLDSTVVNVALPTIQHELHFSRASLSWVVNGYLLTFGGLLLLGGRLGDLVGRKRIFLVGMAAFTAASALCGFAVSAGMLVASRFLQGGSAALMSSMVLGMLGPMFPDPAERTRALSVFAAVTLAGAAIGLPVGGALIGLSWHWIFFINVPIGLATLLYSSRVLEQHDGLGIQAGADICGALLVTAVPSLVVYGLIEASVHGWLTQYTLGPIAIALVLTGVFVVVEGRIRAPLIPLSLFKNRPLVMANIIRLFFAMGIFSINFLGSQFLQSVVRYSPFETGAAFVPNSIIIAIMSVLVVPRLLRRIPGPYLIVAGLVVVAGGLLLFSQVPTSGDYLGAILPAILVVGFGVGMVFTPTVMMALSSLAEGESGVGSGLTNVSIQVGGSIGVALLASISASRTESLLKSHMGEASARGGYRVGFVVAAGCVLVAVIPAVTFILRSRNRLDSHIATRTAGLTSPADRVLEQH